MSGPPDGTAARITDTQGADELNLYYSGKVEHIDYCFEPGSDAFLP